MPVFDREAGEVARDQKGCDCLRHHVFRVPPTLMKMTPSGIPTYRTECVHRFFERD